LNQWLFHITSGSCNKTATILRRGYAQLYLLNGFSIDFLFLPLFVIIIRYYIDSIEHH
jgi:hypothetical protein